MAWVWPIGLVMIGVVASLAFAGRATTNGDTPDISLYGEKSIRPIVMVTGGSTSLTIDAPGVTVDIDTTESRETYSILDHLGSTRVVGVEQPPVRYEYGPFGSSTTDATYAGHPYDNRKGTYWTPSRVYDSASGRFLSVDSRRQGSSPYPYAGNNPITNVDRQGDIYLPFYIKSGFVSDDDPHRTTTVPSAKLIREIIGGANEPEQTVRSDEFFFSHSENERPGSRFASWGRTFVQHEFYAAGATRPQHGDDLYWIVGGEVSVQRPMDVAEVFESWWALRPELASNIVVVDVTGVRNASAPIREALHTAGILHGFVNAQPLDARSNRFLVNGVIYDRANFGLYVRSTAEGLDSHRRALGQRVIQRLMPQYEAGQPPPPRRPPYHAQTASDRLPEQTVPEVVPDLLEGATGLGDFGER